MCGIFGFFSGSRVITKKELLLSIQGLRHRGPDSTGAVVFRNGSTRYCPADLMPEGEWFSVLGHARLSIIDLTQAANQPMTNEDESVWIVYNGEIYNFKEIREVLITKGHRFQSRSDTEVILHGYEEWGIDLISHLRGMFAFAIVDKKNNKIFLARDRLGVKPLKYFFDGETLIFASELKGMIHLVPKRPSLDSINRFLTLKYIPSPHTFIEGVKKVSPGELVEFDLESRRLTTRRYWKPILFLKSDVSFKDAKDHFKSLLSESVFIRTVSDVPIGVYLSGGIDSSAIVTFLKENGVDDITSFTIKFDRHGYDESHYAKMISDIYKTKHYEFQIPVLTYDDMREVICSLDEPFGDPSYIPTYYLSKFTSEHVKVILSGDGGDELLGSYKRYFIHSRGGILERLPRMQLNFIKKLPPEINKKSFSGKLQRIAEQLSQGYWTAYLLRFNGLDDSFKRFVMVSDFYHRMNTVTIESLVDINDDFKKIMDTKERLIWIDLQTYLPDYILTKTDLALMSHSVEGRNPFVDYKLVEFSNMLAPEFKFREGGKYILKNILSDYLPEEILYRKKMGFSPPIKYWFKDNIDVVNTIFSREDFVSTDIFDIKRIHQAIEKFKTTDINISEQLWLIIVLELWRRSCRI